MFLAISLLSLTSSASRNNGTRTGGGGSLPGPDNDSASVFDGRDFHVLLSAIGGFLILAIFFMMAYPMAKEFALQLQWEREQDRIAARTAAADNGAAAERHGNDPAEDLEEREHGQDWQGAQSAGLMGEGLLGAPNPRLRSSLAPPTAGAREYERL